MLAAGAAAVTVVLWASAFVAIRHVGQEFSAGALSLGRLLVGSVLLGIFVFTRPRRWPAKGGLEVPADLRPALVRRLQPRAERGRASPRRRDDRDAREHRPVADRTAGRRTAARGLPASARDRQRRRVRRCRPDRAVVVRGESRDLGCPALPGGRGRVRHRCRVAEAAARPAARARGDLAVVPDRRDRCLPFAPRWSGRRPTRGRRPSGGSSSSARSRPRSPSRPGLTRWRGRRPAGWARRRTWCRR